MYATNEGFMQFVGYAGYDIITRIPDIDAALADCEARMFAYIAPNTPCSDAQITAFTSAVYAQLAYEYNDANAQLTSMPDNISGFTVNGFSAQIDRTGSSSISLSGLSKRARAELQMAGLLYRGVPLC